MRPSDENQHRSKRPNLFSSSHRPAGNDDNILARLEKQAPAALSGTAEPRTRALWLGAATLVVAALIGTLAMLAQQNAGRTRALDAVATSAAVTAPAPQPAWAAGDGNDSETGSQAALIIDNAPPPLVKLASAAPSAALSARPAARVAVARPAPARSQPVVHVAANPLLKAVSNARASVVRIDNAPGRTRIAAGAALHKPRAAGPVRTEVVIDTDVALLAAILAQSRQIAEREQAEHACSGAKCSVRSGAQQ